MACLARRSRRERGGVSPPAEALSTIQRSFGRGLDPQPGEAALFFSDADADADGDSTGGGPQVVGLWVPIDQQAEAESALRSAGFVVS